MRYTDLELTQLLEYQPEGGVIRFAGQRTVLMDAIALGLWRRELIETVGVTVARGVLTRFGYAHGWRTAMNLQHAFPWDSERDWKVAGGRLHMLQGLVELVPIEPLPTSQGSPPFAEANWRSSYEAEQHLANLGRATEPVCWTLCGFASGYLSFCNGAEVVCIEDQCVGCGDNHCHMIGRTRTEWGDAVEPQLSYYRRECMEASLGRVASALKQTERELDERRKALDEAGGDTKDPSGMVVRSDAMRTVVDLARRVARSDATLLITGESGVGKERIARLVHESSPRAKGPFVAVNCGAVSDSLLESELFGHARGAFTGATSDHAGLFEAAKGGTLFLDEIGEVTPGLQVKLLRALQEREIRRVGETRARPLDVRVVAATNRNLADDVTAGRFRQDLYYRLRVIEVTIPPLRNRREDILALARVMLARSSARLGKPVTGLSPEAADALVRHTWPGNVRELENAIERAAILCDGTRVEQSDLPEEIRKPSPPPILTANGRTLDDVEREYILAVLAQNGGNQARTATQLGIGTATLYRKLRQYGRSGAPVRATTS